MLNIVTFSTNKSYQEYAIVLVKSLRLVYQGRIVCRCVNCEEAFIELLKNYDIEIIIDNVELNTKKRLKNRNESVMLKYYKHGFCNDEITYTCHSRFKNAEYIFKKYTNCIVALVDCDFLIMQNIDNLFNIVDNDIMIMDSVNCIHEDCIVVVDSEGGKKFINEVNRILNKNLFFWDQDTVALKEVFSSPRCLKVGKLELKFKDYTLSDSSVIWSGDGYAKFDKKFIDKYNEIKNL
jgi:hypothetical protein